MIEAFQIFELNLNKRRESNLKNFYSLLDTSNERSQLSESPFLQYQTSDKPAAINDPDLVTEDSNSSNMLRTTNTSYNSSSLQQVDTQHQTTISPNTQHRPLATKPRTIITLPHLIGGTNHNGNVSIPYRPINLSSHEMRQESASHNKATTPIIIRERLDSNDGQVGAGLLHQSISTPNVIYSSNTIPVNTKRSPPNVAQTQPMSSSFQSPKHVRHIVEYETSHSPSHLSSSSTTTSPLKHLTNNMELGSGNAFVRNPSEIIIVDQAGLNRATSTGSSPSSSQPALASSVTNTSSTPVQQLPTMAFKTSITKNISPTKVGENDENNLPTVQERIEQFQQILKQQKSVINSQSTSSPQGGAATQNSPSANKGQLMFNRMALNNNNESIIKEPVRIIKALNNQMDSPDDSYLKRQQWPNYIYQPNSNGHSQMSPQNVNKFFRQQSNGKY